MNPIQNSAPGQRKTGGTQEGIASGTKCNRVPTDREVIERLVSVEAQIEWAGRRFLQQILTEAQAAHWQRRAQVFEDARRKPGDFEPPHLRVSEAERADRDRDLHETALACRRKAQILRELGDPEAAYTLAMAVCEPLAPENRIEERRAA